MPLRIKELIPISKCRKQMGQLEKTLNEHNGRFAITNNGKVIAIVVSPGNYKEEFPFRVVDFGLPKKHHTEEEWDKLRFNGGKTLSQDIDNILYS